jgi:hypothetical protein
LPRSKLLRRQDNVCNTVAPAAAIQPVEDYRGNRSLALIGLVAAFTNNSARGKRNILRRQFSHYCCGPAITPALVAILTEFFSLLISAARRLGL